MCIGFIQTNGHAKTADVDKLGLTAAELFGNFCADVLAGRAAAGAELDSFDVKRVLRFLRLV